MGPDQMENAERVGYMIGMGISVLIGVIILVALIGVLLWTCGVFIHGQPVRGRRGQKRSSGCSCQRR